MIMLKVLLMLLSTLFTPGWSLIAGEQNHIGCQHRSTSGRDYRGTANITEDGIPCQKWSDTQPHDHKDTSVGDHNFCRNPDGDSKVWCYTNDPEIGLSIAHLYSLPSGE